MRNKNLKLWTVLFACHIALVVAFSLFLIPLVSRRMSSLFLCRQPQRDRPNADENTFLTTIGAIVFIVWCIAFRYSYRYILSTIPSETEDKEGEDRKHLTARSKIWHMVFWLWSYLSLLVMLPMGLFYLWCSFADSDIADPWLGWMALTFLLWFAVATYLRFTE